MNLISDQETTLIQIKKGDFVSSTVVGIKRSDSTENSHQQTTQISSESKILNPCLINPDLFSLVAKHFSTAELKRMAGTLRSTVVAQNSAHVIYKRLNEVMKKLQHLTSLLSEEQKQSIGVDSHIQTPSRTTEGVVARILNIEAITRELKEKTSILLQTALQISPESTEDIIEIILEYQTTDALYAYIYDKAKDIWKENNEGENNLDDLKWQHTKPHVAILHRITEGLKSPTKKSEYLLDLSKQYEEGSLEFTSTLRASLDNARAITDPMTKSKALSDISQRYWMLDNLEAALDVAKEIPDSSIKSHLLDSISVECSWKKEFQNAIRAAELIPLVEIKINRYIIISREFQKNNNRSNALSLLEKTRELLETEPDSINKTNQLLSISQIYTDIDNPHLVLHILGHAFDITEKLEDINTKNDILERIFVYCDSRFHSESLLTRSELDIFKKALESAQTTDDISLETMILLTELARLYIDKETPLLAVSLLDQAADILEEAYNEDTEISHLQDIILISDLYLCIGELEKAESIVKKISNPKLKHQKLSEIRVAVSKKRRSTLRSANSKKIFKKNNM